MDNKVDLRPQAIDMTLCVNKMCINKCKRYYAYWKPNYPYQSYMNPANKYDKDGKQIECKSRLGEKMILNKWNYKTHKYDKTNIPDSYKCKTYSNDMNELVTCPHCGDEIEFGESYTSLEFHTEIGFGYAVCESCYQDELRRRDQNNQKGEKNG